MSLNSGTYQLHITIERPIHVHVGALGEVKFTPGNYIYTGRAKRGLQSRLERHQKKVKPLHWHIDYLLQHPATKLSQTEIISFNPEVECMVNQRLLKKEGITIAVPGFGASDCKAGCGGHLVRRCK
ncbi:MAG: DUF123 domain-containing protein [Fidelibacterota bacterium]